MRKNCVLSKLTEEKQADLFDSLSSQTYEAVQKYLTQPPPDGLGVRVHFNTLFRFFQERQAQIRARDLAHLAAAGEGGATISERAVPFFAASQTAFAHSTYLIAHSPLNPANYRAVARTLHQCEDVALKREYLDIARQQLALARERLQLDRIQFEYNAARAALALLPELNEIDRRTDIDDEAKVWRARDRLFGQAQTPATAPVTPPNAK